MHTNKKEGAFTHPPKMHLLDCTFTVYQHIKSGLNPSSLYTKNRISKRKVMDALNKLKSLGLITKVGYGTWEINNTTHTNKKEGAFIHHDTPTYTPPRIKKISRNCRAHAFIISLKVPDEPHKTSGWNNRENILKIPFKKIPQGQQISCAGINKIWLCKHSIVFYFSKLNNYYSDNAEKAFNLMLNDLMSRIIPSLEQQLKINTLRSKNGYDIKVNRQHYALVDNVMAKKYHNERKGFVVIGRNGPRLWIDFSPSDGSCAPELETGDRETAVKDNMAMQKFCNFVMDNPGKIEEGTTNINKVISCLDTLAKEQLSYRQDLTGYGREIKNHSEMIGKMSVSMQELGEGIKKLVNVIESLKTYK